MTRFLNVVYSNINGKNIDLVIQLFETMNEFTAVRLFLGCRKLYYSNREFCYGKTGSLP